MQLNRMTAIGSHEAQLAEARCACVANSAARRPHWPRGSTIARDAGMPQHGGKCLF